MQILVILGSWAFYTLPRMKYSKLELRAETFRALSLDPKTPFVFWNLVLPTLTFRVILDLVGL